MAGLSRIAGFGAIRSERHLSTRWAVTAHGPLQTLTKFIVAAVQLRRSSHWTNLFNYSRM